jgi:hypothetical protein
METCLRDLQYLANQSGVKTPSETARLALHVTYKLEPLMLGANSKVSVLLVFIL